MKKLLASISICSSAVMMVSAAIISVAFFISALFSMAFLLACFFAFPVNSHLVVGESTSSHIGGALFSSSSNINITPVSKGYTLHRPHSRPTQVSSPRIHIHETNTWRQSGLNESRSEASVIQAHICMPACKHYSPKFCLINLISPHLITIGGFCRDPSELAPRPGVCSTNLSFGSRRTWV